ILLDVVHRNRLRIDGVDPPRRVAVDGGAILVGEVAPRAEAHPPVAVEEQDARAVDSEPATHVLERGLEEFVEGRRARTGVGNRVEELDSRRRQATPGYHGYHVRSSGTRTSRSIVELALEREEALLEVLVAHPRGAVDERDPAEDDRRAER